MITVSPVTTEFVKNILSSRRNEDGRRQLASGFILYSQLESLGLQSEEQGNPENGVEFPGEEPGREEQLKLTLAECRRLQGPTASQAQQTHKGTWKQHEGNQMQKRDV